MAGIGGTPLGFAVFVGVKLAGYTIAASHLRKYYGTARADTFVIGLGRTAIGVVVGGGYGALWVYIIQGNLLSYFILLFPIRIAEWFLLIWLFFDRRQKEKNQMAVRGGTVLSYALDLIGVFTAIVVPGGVWVC